MNHPSYLELDRFALGAAGAATVEATIKAHLAECTRCRGHISGLRDVPTLPAALRAKLTEAPVPATVTVAGLFERWLGGRRNRLVGATALAGAMAVAAVVWLAPRAPTSPTSSPLLAPSGYDGVKGLPSVWIYVKHDSELALWDGERPLSPGDRLRLKVDPQELTHVDVFSVDDAGTFRPVYGSPLARGVVTTLPPAWQLDDRSQRESLIVVLANAPVSAAAAKRFAETGSPSGVWFRRFELRPVRPATPARGTRPR